MASTNDEIDRAFDQADAAVKATVITQFKTFVTDVRAHYTTLSVGGAAAQDFDTDVVDLARRVGSELRNP